jgi:hypothetical protein
MRSLATFEKGKTSIHVQQRNYLDYTKDSNSEEANERIRKIIERRKVKYPSPGVMIGAPPNGCLDGLEMFLAASKGNLLAKQELERTHKGRQPE